MNQENHYSSALLVGLGSSQAFAHQEKAHDPQKPNIIIFIMCAMTWGMEIWVVTDSHNQYA